MAARRRSVIDEAETIAVPQPEEISPLVLAHELRSPLGAIQGLAGLIGAEAYGPLSDPRYRKAARQIEDACRHMEALIADVVAASHREFGDDVLLEGEVDLSDLVASAQAWLQRDIVAAGVVVRARVNLQPVVVWGDARRLRQAVLNVLGNAVKYAPRGSRIAVEVGVSPEGVGITVVNDARAGDAISGGAGLGLYVTRRQMRLHGGELFLKRQPDGGVLARLALPAARWVRGG
jgi:signal transduction histidine kinase